MSRKLYPEGTSRLYVPLPHSSYALLEQVATELNTSSGRLVANFITEQMGAFQQLLDTIQAAKKNTDLGPLKALLEAKALEANELAGTLGKDKK